MTLIFLGWATWGSTALATLLKTASRRLSELNDELQKNQQLLEQRISERTSQLQESQAQLVQQEKRAAFGLLAAGIAHEVGNPLAAISSLVQMLKRRQNDAYTGERLWNWWTTSCDAFSGRCASWSTSAARRPRSGGCAICTKSSTRPSTSPSITSGRKGKRIVTRFAEDLPKLRAVHDQLVQVFLNLILNALDATDEGGTIELSTELKEG